MSRLRSLSGDCAERFSPQRRRWPCICPFPTRNKGGRGTVRGDGRGMPDGGNRQRRRSTTSSSTTVKALVAFLVVRSCNASTQHPQRLTPKLALSHGGVGVCWGRASVAMTSKVTLEPCAASNGSAVTLAASGLRLSARHAGAAPHSAVTELGVGDSSRLPKFARA